MAVLIQGMYIICTWGSEKSVSYCEKDLEFERIPILSLFLFQLLFTKRKSGITEKDLVR